MKPALPAPRFCSRIRLVSSSAFDRLPLREMNHYDEYADVPWTVWSRVALRKRAYTDGAYNCNAGGVTDGDRVTLFHLIPDPHYVENFSHVDEGLTRDIERLRQSGRPLRAFLTGGKADDSGSRKLFDRLRALFERHGIPVSFLWSSAGQYGVGLHYAADEDTWTLACMRGFSDLSATPSDFALRHIDAGDTLELSDRS